MQRNSVQSGVHKAETMKLSELPAVATCPEAVTQSLPPRLRQTLERLLAGESDKEIARRLGISRHTVHEYCGDLYRSFGVGGRGELMAMLLRACP